MSIDEAIMSHRLRKWRSEALILEISIANAQANISKDAAKIEMDKSRLDRMRRDIEHDEQELYWMRMQELLHTPCWRYRVTA